MSAEPTAGVDAGHETPRVLPAFTPLNAEFWSGGRNGELRIRRCQACGFWTHPPRPMCPRCHGRDLPFETASGHGTVYSFVVNHYPWRPGLRLPYIVAVVELDEQPDLRLTTNIAGCEPADMRIGMRVEVVFEQQDDAFIPLFRPRESVT